MIHFSSIDEHQDAAKSIHKKLFQMKQYRTFEGPFSMHRTGSNEKVFVSEIPHIIIMVKML